MCAKFTCNDIMQNTKKNVAQIYSCRPRMHNIGSKKPEIFIKTSGVVRRIFFRRRRLKFNIQ